jgi:hypothetical protein
MRDEAGRTPGDGVVPAAITLTSPGGISSVVSATAIERPLTLLVLRASCARCRMLVPSVPLLIEAGLAQTDIRLVSADPDGSPAAHWELAPLFYRAVDAGPLPCHAALRYDTSGAVRVARGHAPIVELLTATPALAVLGTGSLR